MKEEEKGRTRNSNESSGEIDVAVVALTAHEEVRLDEAVRRGGTSEQNEEEEGKTSAPSDDLKRRNTLQLAAVLVPLVEDLVVDATVGQGVEEGREALKEVGMSESSAQKRENQRRTLGR